MDLSQKILSDVIVHMKYAKFIESKQRRENFTEIVTRNIGMHLSKYPDMESELHEAYDAVYQKKVLPSMRSLQFGGKPIEINPARLYNCFSRDTEFITDCGVKSFEDFKDGGIISVLTHTGFWKKAVVRCYGEQEVNNINIVRGSSSFNVKVTANHNWIKHDGERTNDLKKGDQLLSAPWMFDNFNFDSAEANEKLYWCYGYVYGDGTRIKSGPDKKYSHSMVRLCGKDSVFEERFTSLGFKSSSPNSICGDVMIYTGKYLKTLPDLETDSINLVRAFVAGYLSADGHKVNDKTMLSKYRGIQSSNPESIEFIKKAFPAAGAYIFSEKDLTGQKTNFGIRPKTSLFGVSTCISSRTAHQRFVVKSIQKLNVQEVWCLEVEDHHSFVLPFGLCTGNCCFMHIDHSDAFSELMFLLLAGCGVGYSIQKHHVAKLPPITRPLKTRRYLVGDSIEGWADATKVLVESYLGQRKSLPLFDFSDIRPQGTPLKTSGGKAPGPSGLKKALFNIQQIFDEKEDGERLLSLEAHEICCHLAEAVRSGGIRRSAMIALFSFDDEEMLSCKFDKWWKDKPHLGRSNNSAVILRHKIKEEQFLELWDKIKANNSGEPGFFFTNDQEWGLNPCAEISLRHQQFCNLVTVLLMGIETQEELNRLVKMAARIATFQASYTNFHYLRDAWQEVTEREALIGVSLTGIVAGLWDKLNLKEAAQVVKDENARVAKLLGINPAARCTTVKPEGTSSCVFGCSSGIHAYHNDYYIRRVTVGKEEPLYSYLLNNHPELVEDDYLKPATQAFIKVPQKAPEGAVTRKETALQLLTRVTKLYKDWVVAGHRKGHNTNNVSSTITIKPNEWDRVGNWMWENRNNYTALAIMPHDDHTYNQTPFEDISEEKFTEMFASLVEINLKNISEDQDNTKHSEEVACAGGACAI